MRSIAIIVWMIGLAAPLSVQASDEVRFLEWSGFTRVVGGYLDDDDLKFAGYENHPSFGQQSLVALQPTLSFSPQWSLTGQWLAHSSDQRSTGLEWLYLSYRPASAWHLRAGKLRTPFFRYSDGIDVGFAYPWITPPAQVYNNYLFDTYQGGSVSYSHSWPSLALALEGYYGQFDGDVYIAGNRLGVDVRVADLTGVVLNLLSHNINVRLSYHSGYNDTDLPDFDLIRVPLEQAGFGRSADSLDSHGRIHIVQGALSYDSLHSFWQAEWVRTTTEFDFTPELVGYYLTAGAYVGDVSLHATYAASSYGSVSGETELQPFLENPADPRFALARTYYGILDFIPDGSMDSYSVGARWNVRLDMALKAEISWLQETAPQSGFFANSASPQSKQSAWLYQLGWEWVF